MLSFNPYLNFKGNTEEVFNFYKSVFGGEFTMVMRFGQVSEMGPIPDADKEKIMHIGLQVGPGTILMGSDSTGAMAEKMVTGNNFYISIGAESRAQADDIFTKLSAGGNVEMAMADMFWGDYFGMVEDKFGTHWMMNFNEKYQQQQP